MICKKGCGFFYLVAAVPFIDDTVEGNGEWHMRKF